MRCACHRQARRSSAVATADPTTTLSSSARGKHAAPSARATCLLFTLLGEFVLTTDGTAWTSAVLAAFARLGIEEKATRQALMRTAAAGWLEPEKLGRRTRWRLTASAQKMLTEGADRIYSFSRPGRELGRPLAAGVRPDPGERPPRPARGAE